MVGRAVSWLNTLSWSPPLACSLVCLLAQLAVRSFSDLSRESNPSINTQRQTLLDIPPRPRRPKGYSDQPSKSFLPVRHCYKPLIQSKVKEPTSPKNNIASLPKVVRSHISHPHTHTPRVFRFVRVSSPTTTATLQVPGLNPPNQKSTTRTKKNPNKGCCKTTITIATIASLFSTLASSVPSRKGNTSRLSETL